MPDIAGQAKQKKRWDSGTVDEKANEINGLACPSVWDAWDSGTSKDLGLALAVEVGPFAGLDEARPVERMLAVGTFDEFELDLP